MNFYQRQLIHITIFVILYFILFGCLNYEYTKVEEINKTSKVLMVLSDLPKKYNQLFDEDVIR